MTHTNNVYPFRPTKRAEGTGKPPGILAGSTGKEAASVGPVLEFPAAGLQALIEHYSNVTRIAMTHEQLDELRPKRKLMIQKDGVTAELVCLPLGLQIHLMQMSLVQAGELVTRYRLVVYNGSLLKPTRHALAGASDAEVRQLVKEILASTYNTLTCLGLTNHLQPQQLAVTESATSNVFVRMLD